MSYDYFSDPIGKACLEEAYKGKSPLSFGAVLVKDNIIIGRGRNRLSTPEERASLRYVDYAIHAEQACILDAQNTLACFMPDHVIDSSSLAGSTVYVLGIVRAGKRKGKLTTRRGKVFICKKCPHALQQFGLSVCIPHINGWVSLTPEEAMRTAQKLCGKGYWQKFHKK